MPDLWVLTCAPGNRANEVASLFQSLGSPPGVVVTTQPDPLPFEFLPDVDVLRYEGTDISIGKWWTLGLDHIAKMYADDPEALWDVLIIESDARMSVEDVNEVRLHMRTLDCVMAGADWRRVLKGQAYHVRRDNKSWIPDPEFPDAGRIPGIACVVAGEAGIRHDIEFRWWLADDDFEWQHRVGGGTVLVGGTNVWHTGTQGELQGERLQAWNEDQGKFMKKWGGMPGTGGILDIETVVEAS